MKVEVVKAVPIPDFEGYMVNSRGDIFSLKQDPKGRRLKQFLNKGYPQVSLCKDFKRYTFRVHRLVLKSFIGDSDLEVNHINGKKHDNRLENLEYVTRSRNCQHAHDNGLVDSARGSRQGNSKLTEDLVIWIRCLYETGDFSQRELAKIYSISQSVIWEVLNEKSWRHV